MRLLPASLAAIVATAAITACSSGSSSNSSDSATAAPADTKAAAAPADTTAAPARAGDVLPTYPGATTQAAGGSSGMGHGASAGKVLATNDSFAKVYAWYQQHMPAGSERAHMTTPVESAVFMTGATGSAQTTVSISRSGGKTMITIARVTS